MNFKGSTVCSLLVFISLVYKSSAIECYYCSSANNSACLDMDTYDSETVAKLIPRVNCETSVQSPGGQYDFFCRKIIQTIYLKQMAEVRVTRGCGWKRHKYDCYKADNRDHLETVCQCFTPYCNAAEHVDPTAATALFLLLSACLYFLR